jgi:hypothetical protein
MQKYPLNTSLYQLNQCIPTSTHSLQVPCKQSSSHAKTQESSLMRLPNYSDKLHSGWLLLALASDPIPIALMAFCFHSGSSGSNTTVPACSTPTCNTAQPDQLGCVCCGEHVGCVGFSSVCIVVSCICLTHSNLVSILTVKCGVARSGDEGWSSGEEEEKFLNEKY